MGLPLSLTFTLTALSLLMGILGNFLAAFAKDAEKARSEARKAKDAGDTAAEKRENKNAKENLAFCFGILIVIGIITYYLVSLGSLAMTIDETPKLNLSANLTCNTPQSCTGFVTNTPPLSCDPIDTKSSEILETIKVVYVERPKCTSDIDGLKHFVNSRNYTAYQIISLKKATL